MIIRTNKLEDKFIGLYLKIFDTKGNTKLCGRDSCIELIETATSINNTRDYGNINTGMMNIYNINKLYTDLIK